MISCKTNKHELTYEQEVNKQELKQTTTKTNNN